MIRTDVLSSPSSDDGREAECSVYWKTDTSGLLGFTSQPTPSRSNSKVSTRASGALQQIAPAPVTPSISFSSKRNSCIAALASPSTSTLPEFSRDGHGKRSHRLRKRSKKPHSSTQDEITIDEATLNTLNALATRLSEKAMRAEERRNSKVVLPKVERHHVALRSRSIQKMTPLQTRLKHGIPTPESQARHCTTQPQIPASFSAGKAATRKSPTSSTGSKTKGSEAVTIQKVASKTLTKTNDNVTPSEEEVEDYDSFFDDEKYQSFELALSQLDDKDLTKRCKEAPNVQISNASKEPQMRDNEKRKEDLCQLLPHARPALALLNTNNPPIRSSPRLNRLKPIHPRLKPARMSCAISQSSSKAICAPTPRSSQSSAIILPKEDAEALLEGLENWCDEEVDF